MDSGSRGCAAARGNCIHRRLARPKRTGRRGTAVGEPFRITNFEGPGAHILPNIRTLELSVGGGRLVVPVVRPKGGLWLLERPTR